MKIEVKALKKTYQQGQRCIEVLRGVDFSMEAGSFVHLMGRSGSGKSTFLNAIAALAEVEAERLQVGEYNLLTMTEVEKSSFRNQHIGYVSQQASLLTALPVFENVCLPWFFEKREGDVEGRARYLMERLDLRGLEKAYPSELSGGELRRVQVARALINEPSLLLADEATNDLDRDNVLRLMELFTQFSSEGLSILMVSHDASLSSYAQTHYRLEDGQLEAVDASH